MVSSKAWKYIPFSDGTAHGARDRGYRNKIVFWALAFSLLLNALLLLYLPRYAQSSTTSAVGTGSLLVYNETFGFGEIILISLPDRTDRRDAVSLLTSLYNVSVKHTIDAVRGGEVSDVALPFSGARESLDAGHIGSWRSHMQAFKYVVDNRIETALIIEDDIDWDVQVKAELRAFSDGLRASKLRPPWSSEELARAPYGLDWDILHLGPGTIRPAPSPFNELGTPYFDPYRIPHDYDDERVRNKLSQWLEVLHATNTSRDDHRVIVPSYHSLGLGAIAVTYQGAQRLLQHLSFLGDGLERGLDFGIVKLLQDGKLYGWTPVPPLMGQWRIGGPADSDLRVVDSAPGVGDSNRNGYTLNLLDSARKVMLDALQRPHRWDTTMISSM